MFFCEKCGAELEDGEVFCWSCGEKVYTEAKNAGNAPAKGSPESKKAVGRKRNPLFITAPVMIMLLLATCLILYFTVFSKEAGDRREIRRQMDLAEHYLDELDYERAIAAYQTILEIDPNNEDALEALNEAYELWADADPASADMIYGEAAEYYQKLSKRSDSGAASEMQAKMEGKISKPETEKKTAEKKEPAEAVTPAGSRLTLSIAGAGETEAIAGAEVRLSGDAEELTAVSDGSGKVVFEGLADGTYRLSVNAGGFNGRELDVEVSGPEVNRVVALAPQVNGDDAVVLLCWEGDRDLDLCAFNTAMKEYVNIGHPMDSEGNVFLYADHGADLPFETIYIHNLSAEVTRTIYVTDVKKARKGESSLMESEGVTVAVYDKSGLIYYSRAGAGESAPLWCPCYCYAGKVYDQNDYIYDTTSEAYAWISFEEKDAVAGASAEDGQSGDESWKPLMKAAVEEKMREYWNGGYVSGLDIAVSESEYYGGSSFNIGYIDNDSIPEIFIGPYAWGAMGTGACVLYIKDGKVSEYGMSWCDHMSYIPYSGKVRIDHGMHMPMGQIYFSYFPDGGEIGAGYFDQPGWYDGTDHSFSGDTYEYRWNDDPVSEAEFNRKLSEVFSGDIHSFEQEKGYSYDELMAYLTPAAASVSNSSEKGFVQAYTDVIKKDPDGLRNDSIISIDYGLIYLNDDDIPELAVYIENMNQLCSRSCIVYTYRDGKAVRVTSDSFYGSTYAEAYYEKKDYIRFSYASEGPTDESDIDSYYPIFRTDAPVYKGGHYKYWDYENMTADSLAWIEYDRWNRGETEITKAEYNSFVSSLGTARSLENECVGYDEILNRLAAYR